MVTQVFFAKNDIFLGMEPFLFAHKKIAIQMAANELPSEPQESFLFCEQMSLPVHQCFCVAAFAGFTMRRQTSREMMYSVKVAYNTH